MSKGITWRQTFLGDPTMTSCAKAMRLMQSVMDGELESPDLEMVVLHLEKCVNCGLKAQTYQAIKNSVAATGAVTLDPAELSDLQEFARALMRE